MQKQILDINTKITTPPDNIENYDIGYEKIQNGIEGTRRTISYMIENTIKGSIDFAIIELARKIVSLTDDTRNASKVAELMFHYVKNTIQYVRDPIFAELIQSPRRTIELKSGDCDDQACLFGALCLAVGVQIRFVTVGTKSPNSFSHVYTEIKDGDMWIAHDTIVKNSYPGWYPSPYTCKAIWELNGEMFLAGWFNDMVKKIKKFINKAIKQIKKAVSDIARKIQAEKRRFFEKVTKEFARWEKNNGLLGKLAVLAVKTLTIPFSGGLLFIVAQTTKNPFKLTSTEWELFAQLASIVGSLVMTIVTGGVGAGVLSSVVTNMANTATSLHDIKKQKEERKKLLKELETQYNVIAAEEERVQREAINKLKFDIEILEKIEQKLNEYHKILTQFKTDQQLFLIEQENEIKKQFQLEYNNLIENKEKYIDQECQSHKIEIESSIENYKKTEEILKKSIDTLKIQFNNEVEVTRKNIEYFNKFCEQLNN